MLRVLAGLCVVTLLTATPVSAQENPATPTAPAEETTPALESQQTTTFAFSWRSRPSGRDITQFYPRAAYQQGVQGRALLNCVVQENRRLECTVAEEEPTGWGFGEAALGAARRFRMHDEFPNGQTTVGANVTVNIPFRFAN